MSEVLIPDFKEKMTIAEQIVLSLPNQLHPEPVHRFADGLYCRELTMLKDTVLVTRVHKKENFAFILTGKCTVVSESGSVTYTAPCLLKTMAGTKRLIRIYEDSTWITVHSLPDDMDEYTDIEEIEAYFACDTLDDYDQFLLDCQPKMEAIL
jgi:hypothetical protein